MSKLIYKLSISLVLLALSMVSVMAVDPDYGDECTEVTKISVNSGDPIQLQGSPYNTAYYVLAWSDDGFTLRKNGVALTATQLAAQTISFDAPVAPGQYKVTLSVAQKKPDGTVYTTSCVDDICVQIEVTKPACFTTTPICEQDMSTTAPQYCYAGTDKTGNSYAWYVFTSDPGASPDVSTLTPDFTTKCMVLPAVNVPDGEVHNSRWIYLVVTDVDGLKTYCGPTEQVILEDPVAGIADVTTP